jgi:hypothetical protein
MVVIFTSLYPSSILSLAGLHQPLQADYKGWAALSTECYLKHTWKFLSLYKIRMERQDSTLVGKREGHRSIMDAVQIHCSTSELWQVNICRLHLQVWWLSDIITGDGRYISATTTQRRTPIRESNMIWPIQGTPPADAWEVWIRALSALGRKQRDQQIVLDNPLGRWNHVNNCEWLYDPTSDRIMQKESGKTYVKKVGRPTRKADKRYIVSATVDDTSGYKMAATVNLHNRKQELDVEGLGSFIPPTILQRLSFKQFASQNTRWIWWAHEIQCSDEDALAIIQNIGTTGGLVVSDGSFKDLHGAASIVLEGVRYGTRVGTSVTVPGDPAVQCAYRSEAAGILAAIQLVNALAQYFGLSQGQCTLGCDGQSALNQCFFQSTGFQVNIPHFDIISEARQELQSSLIQWTKQYIPGHQEIFPLSREAFLNDKMDQQCKKHWEKTHGMAAWSTYNQWNVVAYWTDKLDDRLNSVDWDATGTAMSSNWFARD